MIFRGEMANREVPGFPNLDISARVAEMVTVPVEVASWPLMAMVSPTPQSIERAIQAAMLVPLLPCLWWFHASKIACDALGLRQPISSRLPGNDPSITC